MILMRDCDALKVTTSIQSQRASRSLIIAWDYSYLYAQENNSAYFTTHVYVHELVLHLAVKHKNVGMFICRIHTSIFAYTQLVKPMSVLR